MRKAYMSTSAMRLQTLSASQTEGLALASLLANLVAFVILSYILVTKIYRPHIEVDSRGYHYVVVERGREELRFTTKSFDELLFRVFEGITTMLGFDYELENRDDTRDCRRLAFARQIQLLSQLSENWAKREARKHDRILTAHPFDDLAAARARLARDLVEQGTEPDSAWQIASERYPLP